MRAAATATWTKKLPGWNMSASITSRMAGAGRGTRCRAGGRRRAAWHSGPRAVPTRRRAGGSGPRQEVKLPDLRGARLPASCSKKRSWESSRPRAVSPASCWPHLQRDPAGGAPRHPGHGHPII